MFGLLFEKDLVWSYFNMSGLSGNQTNVDSRFQKGQQRFPSGDQSLFFFEMEISVWVRLSWESHFIRRIFGCIPQIVRFDTSVSKERFRGRNLI